MLTLFAYTYWSTYKDLRPIKRQVQSRSTPGPETLMLNRILPGGLHGQTKIQTDLQGVPKKQLEVGL